MIPILALAFSLIVPTFIGHQLLRFIMRGERTAFLFSAALSYGLGMGILSYVMLILGMLGLTYSPWIIAFALLVLSVLIFISQSFLIRSHSVRSPEDKEERIFFASQNSIGWKLLSSVIYVFIAYYLTYIFWAALSLPIYTWDSMATSAYNAKILFFEGTLKAHHLFAHPSYPLQCPLILTWIALNVGEWNEQLMNIIFPLAFISFVAIFYAFLNQLTDAKKALLGVALLFSSNFIVHHATISYRDIFMMYYFCTAVFLLILWHRKDSMPYLILASLFAGIGTFMKLEGTAYLVITSILLGFLLMKGKSKSLSVKCAALLRFFLPSISLWGIYYVYKMASGLPVSEYVEIDVTNILARTLDALKGFTYTLFFTANWNICWQFLVITLIINLPKLRKDIILQTLLLGLFLFLGFHFTLGIISDKGGHITSIDTLARLCLHAFPLVISLIIIPWEFF